MEKISRCKCLMIGESGTGKTSIIQRLLEPNSIFNNKYIMTTGVNISFKRLKINDEKTNKVNSIDSFKNSKNTFNNSLDSYDEDDDLIDNYVELFIYDVSGKQFYIDLLKNIWCNNVSIVIGVFDVSKLDTFKNLQIILNDLMKKFNDNKLNKNNLIDKNLNYNKNILGVILGNKTDLKNRRFVDEQEAQQLAKKFKFTYFECSAKMNIGIEEVFYFLSSKFVEQILESS